MLKSKLFVILMMVSSLSFGACFDPEKVMIGKSVYSPSNGCRTILSAKLPFNKYRFVLTCFRQIVEVETTVNSPFMIWDTLYEWRENGDHPEVCRMGELL